MSRSAGGGVRTRRRRRAAPRLGPGVVLGTIVVASVAMVAILRLSAGRRDVLSAATELRTASRAVTTRQDDVARTALDRAASGLARARSQAKGFPLGLLAPVPIVGSPGRALADAADAGLEGVAAGRILAQASSSFPTTGTAAIDGHDLGVLHAAALRSEEALAQAARHAARAESRLDGPVGALLPQISGPARIMKIELAQARTRIDGGQRGLALLADLTAPDAEVRLLLLAQDSLELRPTGGYIGSYGVIRLSKGTVQVEEYAATEDLPPTQPPLAPPRDIVPYLGRTHWGLSNVNWWPDFPTTAAAAKEIFRRQGGGEIDGVVAITEHLLIRVLGAIGPLKLPSYGEPVVAEGFEDRAVFEVELKRPVDIPRKRFLIELADVLFGRLFALSGDQVPAVVGALDQAVSAGDIQVWFSDPDRQGLLQGAVIAGNLPRPEGDFVMLVDSNMTASKANAGLVKEASYRVRRENDGRLMGRLEVKVRNDGPRTKINPFYNSFLRLYVPRGSLLVGESPNQGQEEALAPDGPFEVFVQVLRVEPETEEVVVFDYELPTELAAAGRHRVTWFRQAGTPRDVLQATVGTRTGQMTSGVRTLVIEGALDDGAAGASPLVRWLRSRWIIRGLGL